MPCLSRCGATATGCWPRAWTSRRPSGSSCTRTTPGSPFGQPCPSPPTSHQSGPRPPSSRDPVTVTRLFNAGTLGEARGQGGLRITGDRTAATTLLDRLSLDPCCRDHTSASRDPRGWRLTRLVTCRWGRRQLQPGCPQREVALLRHCRPGSGPPGIFGVSGRPRPSWQPRHPRAVRSGSASCPAHPAISAAANPPATADRPRRFSRRHGVPRPPTTVAQTLINAPALQDLAFLLGMRSRYGVEEVLVPLCDRLKHTARPTVPRAVTRDCYAANDAKSP